MQVNINKPESPIRLFLFYIILIFFLVLMLQGIRNYEFEVILFLIVASFIVIFSFVSYNLSLRVPGTLLRVPSNLAYNNNDVINMFEGTRYTLEVENEV